MRVGGGIVGRWGKNILFNVHLLMRYRIFSVEINILIHSSWQFSGAGKHILNEPMSFTSDIFNAETKRGASLETQNTLHLPLKTSSIALISGSLKSVMKNLGDHIGFHFS